MSSAIKKFEWACWELLAQFLARSYVVGPRLENAMDACRKLAQTGATTTIGYWDTGAETPQQIAKKDLAAINSLGASGLNCYMSIKSPPMRFDRVIHRQFAEIARNRKVRLHFDSHAPEDVDATFSLIDLMRPTWSDLGCTLPGRWRRSIEDADWAVDRKTYVRVVKGQWADPVKPEHDWSEGFLSVIDRLAGRARHVAVASHDAPLAKEALTRLLKKNTPCELELLRGLPFKEAECVAQEMGVGIRMYLPYGHGWLPYCISQVYEHPGILLWIVRDLLGGRS
jgi:proline dehydrogenase